MAATSTIKANGYLRGISTYQVLNNDSYTNISQYRYDSMYLYFLKGIVFSVRAAGLLSATANYSCALTLPMASSIMAVGTLKDLILVNKYFASGIKAGAYTNADSLKRAFINSNIEASFTVASNLKVVKVMNCSIKGVSKITSDFTIDKILFEEMQVGAQSMVKANYWVKKYVYMSSRANSLSRVNINSQLLVPTKKLVEDAFRFINVYEDNCWFKNIDFTCVWHSYQQLSQYTYSYLNSINYENITSTFISLEERVKI